MADAQPSRVQVGELPEGLREGADLARLDRDQHIVIRRDQPALPEELDDGPDVDPETGAYRPATYRTPKGNIRRDF